MNNNIIESQLKAYLDNFLKHGDQPQGVFWNNYETAFLRYERLIRQFNCTENFSIHDIGSGVCDLHRFLIENKIIHAYTGTEIVPEMVELSRIKFPEAKLFCRDVLEEPDIEKADIVTLSGTLNMPGEILLGEWEDFTFRLIEKMYSLSNWGISFNILTSYNTFSDPALAYFNPTEIFDFCMRKLSRFVVLDHAYPLYEATITVFHEEYMKQNHPSSAFTKYFPK